MGYSAGVYAAPANSWNPAVAGSAINATDWAALLADLTTALSTCVLKDGTQTITANLPMNGFKLTGLATGSANGNSLRYEQLFATTAINLLGGINSVKTTVASATTPDIWTSTGTLIDYTGTNTATGFAAAPQAGSIRVLVCAGAAVFTAGANVLIQGVASGANYTATAGDVITVHAFTTTQFRLFINPVTGIPGKQPTRQVFTSGSSATYTTPSGCTRINVRCVGGGGGGAAATANAGTAGNNTTFSTLTASGGGAGQVNAGGAGGAASGGDINIPGGGGEGGGNATAANVFMQGGQGGSTAFGGCGSGGQSQGAGGNGATNSGGGGGGGGAESATSSGGGGGGGGYVEKLITAPAATYTYTVGAAASGGSAGTHAGGDGAAGLIIVDEWYT